MLSHQNRSIFPRMGKTGRITACRLTSASPKFSSRELSRRHPTVPLLYQTHPHPELETRGRKTGSRNHTAFSTGSFFNCVCQNSHSTPVCSIIRQRTICTLISKAGEEPLLMYAHTDYNRQNTYFWRRYCPDHDSWPVGSNNRDPFQAGSSPVQVDTARKCNRLVDVGRR